MAHALSHRHHFAFGRHVRYGRDPGLTRGGKIALAVVAAVAGGAVFFFARRAKAAQAPLTTSPQPAVVPATPAGTPAVPAAPPVARDADLAKVLTHDPPPAGDLNVFDAPNGSRIGGAEKDSLVSVLSNDGTFARVNTHNTGRLPDVSGFVHAKFLAAPDAQSIGSAAAQETLDITQRVASAFGF